MKTTASTGSYIQRRKRSGERHDSSALDAYREAWTEYDTLEMTHYAWESSSIKAAIVIQIT